jgi:hypothetical protein
MCQGFHSHEKGNNPQNWMPWQWAHYVTFSHKPYYAHEEEEVVLNSWREHGTIVMYIMYDGHFDTCMLNN